MSQEQGLTPYETSVATLPQNLRFRPVAGAEIFGCWELPKPLFFASLILRLRGRKLPAQ